MHPKKKDRIELKDSCREDKNSEKKTLPNKSLILIMFKCLISNQECPEIADLTVFIKN